MNDVVRGEASESEDETLGLTLKQKVLAAEVSGEASESDEELYEKSLDTSMECNNVDALYNNNLLQRKLIENNLSIWRSLGMFAKNIVTSASKQLVATDQLLIKSQTFMQSVLVTLNQTQTNMRHLHDKSDAVFTSNFIPNINVQNKTQR